MNSKKIEDSIGIIRNQLKRLDSQSFIRDVLLTKAKTVKEVTLLDSLSNVLTIIDEINKDSGSLMKFIMEALKICLYDELTEKVSYSEWSAKFDTYMQYHLGSSEEILSEVLKMQQAEGDDHANSEC